MAAVAIPPGVIERIVEVLEPEEVWLLGSRARRTHGPDSDWDLMAVLPDAASERKLDLAAVWSDLHELRRLRVEVIPIRRCDFEEDRHTLRGVGGREYVFVRHVDRLAIGGRS